MRMRNSFFCGVGVSNSSSRRTFRRTVPRADDRSHLQSPFCLQSRVRFSVERLWFQLQAQHGKTVLVKVKHIRRLPAADQSQGAPAIVVEIQRPTVCKHATITVDGFLGARRRNATSWRQVRRGEPTRIACHGPGPRLPGTTRIQGKGRWGAGPWWQEDRECP